MPRANLSTNLAVKQNFGTNLKAWVLIVIATISLNAYSLNEIPLTLNYQENSKVALDLSSPIGVPVTSKITSGKVKSKRLKEDIFNQPLFVMGDDVLSKSWLAMHADELKSMQAIGFITNVDNLQTIIQLQQKYQLPLLPVNIDPLAKHLDVWHYPFVINEGELWQ